MKRIHTFALCLVAMVTMASMTDAVQAQTKTEIPQKVESIVKVKHSVEWYKTQERLWKAEIDKNSKNEEAWGNYYQAVRYKGWYEDVSDISQQLDAIMEDMGKAIPDTYTYYLMQYYHKGVVADAPNMRKAILMQPDNVESYPDYVSYLLQTGDEELMADILRRWYHSGTYSPGLLNYAYNELIGLAPNAVIFVKGDTPTFSKLILQYGKDIRPDVTIVNETFWIYTTEEFRERIEKKLGLPSFAELVADGKYKWSASWEENRDELYRYLFDNATRPIYFSTTTELPKCTDKIYSEGLVMRYSKKRYDNLEAKRKNYEELYLTDYLYESFQPENYPASATPYNLNYIPCFKSLLDYYKQSGENSRYKKLRNLMLRIVAKTNISDEEKQKYYEEINR